MLLDLMYWRPTLSIWFFQKVGVWQGICEFLYDQEFDHDAAA